MPHSQGLLDAACFSFPTLAPLLDTFGPKLSYTCNAFFPNPSSPSFPSSAPTPLPWFSSNAYLPSSTCFPPISSLASPSLSSNHRAAFHAQIAPSDLYRLWSLPSWPWPFPFPSSFFLRLLIRGNLRLGSIIPIYRRAFGNRTQS